MVPNRRPSLTVAHVRREPALVRGPLARADYTAAHADLRTERSYLDRVPAVDADEHAIAAFVAADRHLDAVQAAVELCGGDALGTLTAALQSFQVVTAHYPDVPAPAGV
jgi:hypothetical protein